VLKQVEVLKNIGRIRSLNLRLHKKSRVQASKQEAKQAHQARLLLTLSWMILSANSVISVTSLLKTFNHI